MMERRKKGTEFPRKECIIKSFYINYLLRKELPSGDSDMTNSSVKRTDSENNNPIGKTKFNFEFTPTNSAISLRRELVGIDSIPHPLLEDWVDEFRELAQVCSWSEETAVATLKTIVSSNILRLINMKRSLTSCLDTLLAHQYCPKERYKYEKTIENIKQKDFYTIQEYVNEIRKYLRKYALCTNMKPELIAFKEEEIFMKGLHKEVKIEMIKLGNHTQDSVTLCIEAVEDTLLQLVPNKQKERNGKPRLPESNKYYDKNLKYCRIHGTCRHDTKECRNTMNNKEQPKKKEIDSKKHSLVLRDPLPKINGLEFTGLINDFHVVFLIDPGATKSFISEKVVKEIGVKSTQLKDPENIQIASGQIEIVTSKVETWISLDKIPDNKFKVELYIISGDLPVVLLGEPFLIQEEVCIDYKEAVIRISDNYLFLDENYKEWRNTPDKELVEKALIASKEMENKQRNDLIYKFARKSPILGTIPNISMSIHLSSEIPIKNRPFPIPTRLLEGVKMEIESLTKLGIIRKSTSNYGFPAFPILKKNGNIRLVVDYRKLNEVTIKDAHPFPNLWEEIRSLPQSKIFSKLDLSMGYHQVCLAEDSKKYTSFVTQFGQFEYNRIPFGLCNAPRVFQRAMRDILGHLSFVKIFLDDILIYSESEEVHKIHLETVLKLFNSNNVAVNFEKSCFFKNQVCYLGHIIDENGIKPDVSIIPEIETLLPIKTTKQAQKLCGFINWFRPYVRDLSQRMKSITDLTRKKTKIIWTEEKARIIREIIEEIRDQVTLAYPDYSNGFILETDASELGMGAILYQQDKIIGMFSKKFTAPQSRYTVTEKEFFAIYTALKHFRNIIFLSEIVIYTDHANLTFQTDPISNRVQRWMLAIGDFDYIIKYKKGNENVVADSLSRCMIIRTNNPIFKFLNRNSETIIQDGKIKPSKLHEERIIRIVHDKLNHPGINTSYNTIKGFFCIKQLKLKIQKMRQSCQKCQIYMHCTHKYGRLCGHLSTKVPFKHISSDIYGPFDSEQFEEGCNQKVYLITIIDRCTRWAEVFLLFSLDSETITAAFDKWLETNPRPDTCLTDQGRQYISIHTRDYFRKKNIEHLTSTAYNPTGNSISERINQTITRVLQTNKHVRLKSLVKLINFTLQNQYHRSLGGSPYELRYGRSNFDPLYRNLTSLVDEYENKDRRSRIENCNRMNKGRIDNEYVIGEEVYRLRPFRKKLDPKWKGPYKILQHSEGENKIVIGNDLEEIKTTVRQVRPLKKGGKCQRRFTN
ncbi:MAG: reverse transcriptase domain-containing protein [Aeromonas sp.]